MAIIKKILEYLEQEINKAKIETVDDIYKQDFNYLMKKAFIRHLEDQGKVKDVIDKNKKIKKVIKW